MRHLRPLLLAPLLILASGTLASSPARAEGTALRADLVEGKAVRLDGVPREWSGLVPLGYTLRGRNGKPDLEAHAGLAYDHANVYVAADVTDDVLRGGGGDKVEVVIGFPGGGAYSISLYPGDPGRVAGAAKTSDGSTVTGARVVEAPRSGGWTLEASIPWSAFPPASSIRVGLRGAIFVNDVDSGSIVKNIVGTAPSSGYHSLPPLNTEAEQSLHDGLLHDRGLHGAPRFNLIADVAGDSMKERVLIYDHYLVVLGSNFRKGSEYYYSDLVGDVVGCETRDLDGDGQREIVVRKRFTSGSKAREMMQVLQFGSSDTPTTIFQHELAVITPDGTVQNEVTFEPIGSRTAIKITTGTARGFNAGNYREPTETGYDPVILPWGTVASQTYRLSRGTYVKASEETQAATPAPASAGPPPEAGLPQAPPPPSPAELMEKVYDLYKQDRGMSGRPRFDIATDVTGDGINERVLLHERDIVVFGKAFKGGRGYSFLTMAQFASPSDITALTARDINGDGKAEIVIKGVIHAKGPGGDPVDREVMLVFAVQGEGIRRVFAAEIGRSMGRKRVVGSVRFGGGAIELAPGSAVGWTAANYPFNQDSGPVGGLEPLLLPWGGVQPVRYRWSNGAFTSR